MIPTYYECLGWIWAEPFLFHPPNRSKFCFLIPLLGLIGLGWHLLLICQFVMREAKPHLVDLVSHCHEGTVVMALTRPGNSCCDCMWTCSRTAVAFSKSCIAKAFNCPASLGLLLNYSHRSVCFWCTALKAVLHCSTRSALPQVACLATRTSASFFGSFTLSLLTFLLVRLWWL